MSKRLRGKNHPSEKRFRQLSELIIQNLRLREAEIELDKFLDTLADESEPSHPEHISYLRKRRLLATYTIDRAELNHQLNQHGINIR